MQIQQKCTLVYKDGLTFLVNIYNDYIDPSFIGMDPTQGDNNPIDTTNRIRAFLENEGWILQYAGQGDDNPNLHYWHFIRTLTY